MLGFIDTYVKVCVFKVCVRGREGGGVYRTKTNEYLDIRPLLVQVQALALEALKCNK